MNCEQDLTEEDLAVLGDHRYLLWRDMQDGVTY